MIEVILTNHDLEWALDLSKQSYAKRSVNKKGEMIYKPRKERRMSSLVGKLGEMGAYNWLLAEGYLPDPWFAMNDDAPDIVTRNPVMRIEVKSWKKSQWDKNLGRSIPSNQFEKICKCNHLIFWMYMDLYKPWDNRIETLGDVCALFKKYPFSVTLAEYSWCRDLKRYEAVRDIEVPNGDGLILRSKQVVKWLHDIKDLREDAPKRL